MAEFRPSKAETRVRFPYRAFNMTGKLLEEKCFEGIEKKRAKIRYESMIKINALGFCVATSWKKNQVSISRSCEMPGYVFEFTKSYKSIVLPTKGNVQIRFLKFDHLDYYLPKSGITRHMNCWWDN
jgi:hypothetical protein